MSAPSFDPTLLPDCETLPASAADGACAEVILQLPAGAIHDVVYWLPALGMPARQYLPLAQALAAQGVAVAIHEWRGIGSSNHRASRRDDWGYRELLQDDLPAGVAAVQARLPQARYWFGGHSLGGQLASLHASLHPRQVAGLLVVASGAPYWRQFRWGGPIWLAFVLAPWLARLVGYLPGRRLGFGGNEARRLIVDWARTGRTGRYAAEGMPDDLEQRLAALSVPLLALRLADDWMGPPASLEWLLGKMPHCAITREVISAADLDGRPAEHFGWMKTPEPLVARTMTWLAAASTDRAGVEA
ncbi:alpha/beta fold hydrolase [Dyella solisilvae]|uniref:Alpha/beta fold hydrolase n=1 Tax=Dyella solisilvae TaxID=1920168 RepID=A0A370KDD6_9GAMM|nr:alpha/beta fold hydrolase [Dyella solisilvae]RDJ00640.1 alpha/beta fold hydrolase [Dyella solisilvae]